MPTRKYKRSQCQSDRTMLNSRCFASESLANNDFDDEKAKALKKLRKLEKFVFEKPRERKEK